MTAITSLCVYCGSSVGRAPAHVDLARDLGRGMAERGIRLVYGGGGVGLMGIVADAVLAGGGAVTGVIPTHLQHQERGHTELTELVVVEDMHTRKRTMFERSDGFVVLPGGLGTLDEAFEIITWRQLKLHDKPIVLADIAGYWAPLTSLVDTVIKSGYATDAARNLFATAGTVEEIFETLAAAPGPRLAPEPEKI